MQIVNISRRNWHMTGLLNVALPHLGRLTRPEHRFLKRAFPLTAAETALFEAARTSGLLDTRLVRLRERARAALAPPHRGPVEAPAAHTASGASAAAAEELQAEYGVLTARMHDFMSTKPLYPWAFELDCGRHTQATHGTGIRSDVCIVNPPMLGYLQNQLVRCPACCRLCMSGWRMR